MSDIDEMRTDVLIIGGGPVGLGLALDLGWRGVNCLLLERGDGVIHYPKMGAMDVRTMEFCRRWGIVDRVQQGGFPEDYGLSITFCTSVFGHLLAQEPYPCMRDWPLPPESPERWQRGSQIWFDPLLMQAASEHESVTLRHHCEMTSFTETEDGVVAEATDLQTGQALRIHARYMVGCDGGGSAIRRTLDIPLQGDPALSYSVGIFFRSPELYKMHGKGDTQRFLFVGPDGTWGNLTVVDGRELWRLTVLGSKDKRAEEGLDVEAALHAMAGGNFPHEVIAVAPWRRSQLVAAQYRRGRVFLAGDAAHTMSPTGGHGMNTGLADAVDLSWKLAATLQGWGGDALLDSYNIERQPIGVRNVNAAARNFFSMVSATDCAAIMDDTPEGEATRARVGVALRQETMVEWETLGTQLGFRYENSPVVVPDGTPPTPDETMQYVPTARPGSRAPHAWLGDGSSTLDLFGRGFVLLCFGDRAAAAPMEAAAAMRGMPLRVECIDDAKIAALYERRLVLVRPDGHVGWRGDTADDSGAALDRVRGTRGAAGAIAAE